MDNDEWVTCPYNRTHRVSRTRIQAHLVRCEQNYPTLAICPYNATHRMKPELMVEHLKSECESHMAVSGKDKPERAVAHLTTPKPTKLCDYMTKDDPENECWDD